MDGSWLAHDVVAPLVGTRFEARTAAGTTVQLVLVEATDSGRPGGVGADGRTRTQFSLVFRGPADVPLEQGTYPIGSDLLDPQPIFIVPIGEDADGRLYEAVFA